MMDDFEWFRNLPDERRKALRPVYVELYEVHKQDRIGGMRKFHSTKTEKLQHLQQIQNEAQNKANDWHDRTVKLEETGADKDAIDTAWLQCKHYSKVARSQDADIEKLVDQVTLITIIIDDHEKTSVFPTLYRLTNNPDYIDDVVIRIADTLIEMGKSKYPDWMMKSRAELFSEFYRRVDEAKDQGIRKSQEAIYDEMMQEIQDQNVALPYSNWGSFKKTKDKKYRR
jgi:hypothetical protein